MEQDEIEAEKQKYGI